MIFSYLLNMQSHPSWVCGLKLPQLVVTSTTAWSHPSWVCGLKPSLVLICMPVHYVTPFVGVWIETRKVGREDTGGSVTPFVGVWIETAVLSVLAWMI